MALMRSEPARIGPYCLEDRLGAGGMGEVYRAWDERLERWVAVKLIRPESAGNPRARERFRREARAAAGLSHPSIVQIHDVVFAEPADAIVMELVDGTPLSDLIARGPMELPAALQLATQIAEGLAVAHGRSVVHRDLKPENVMVDTGGRARILDFGLAKRPGSEASLTADHVVVGTYRAMSPEQARGLEVDARSDLFSFGSLFYEMLSGRSPFPGAAPLETLNRICAARQTPLRELRPEVPAGLSDLVDRLLEKDPARRPQSAGEVARSLTQVAAGMRGDRTAEWGTEADGAGPTLPERPAIFRALPAAEAAVSEALLPAPRRRWVAAAVAAAVLLAAGAVLLFRGWRPGEPVSVAVPRPQVTGTAAGGALMAAATRTALLRGLLALEKVSTLTPEQVDPVPGSPVEVARAVAADEVVTADLDCDSASCVVSLRRIRGADGSLLWTATFEALVGQPYLLSEAVEAHLREGYAGYRVRRGTSGLDVRAQDYREYLQLRHSFEARRGEDLPLDEILDRLAQIRRRSPGFVEAFLLEAEILRSIFNDRRGPADLERGFEVLEQAREIAPSDPRPLSQLVELSLLSARPEPAAGALRELERLRPGDPGVLANRARLLEQRGDTRQALALMREVVRRRPAWNHLLRLADMEFRLGQGDAARGHLEQLLARFPGHYTGQSLLAQVELGYGSPQRAADLYADLVGRFPSLAELVNLGTAYLMLRHYPEAERAFREARDLAPENPFLLLNLADVRLLQGDRREAETLYRQLLDLAARDPAADYWQLQTVRGQALAHLGQDQQALEAVQKALRAAPDNSQVAYETSLVHVLVGDEASARLFAEKALAQGYAPRWFTLPWFAPLRAKADFEALLKQRPLAGSSG